MLATILSGYFVTHHRMWLAVKRPCISSFGYSHELRANLLALFILSTFEHVDITHRTQTTLQNPPVQPR